MINEQILKKLSQIQNNSIYEICQKHKKILYKICITCKSDICSECEKMHVNHYMIKQDEIMPDSEEIKKLQFGIKNYIDDYDNLINKIKKWQNEINEKIVFLENRIKSNIILNSVDFINNYDNIKISLHSIIKFRKIYNSIIEPENKNKKILSFLNEDNFINKQTNIFEYNYFDLNYKYSNYLAIKYLLKDINNYKDNFVKKSKRILEYLNYLTKNQIFNINNKDLNKNFEKVGKNKTYLYYPNIGNKRYIERRTIDPSQDINFKSREIQQDINRISIGNKFNKSYEHFSILFKNKDNHEKDNESLYSLTNRSNGSFHDTIYSKKSYISKIIRNKKEFKNNSEKNNDNKNITKYHSSSNINPKKLFSNSDYSNISNNFNGDEQLTNIKSMIDIQKINNNINKKTYVHKKFILKKGKQLNTNNNKIINKSDNNNYIQPEQLVDNKYINNKKNILNNSDSKKDINKSPLNKKINYSEKRDNNIIDIPISFIKNNNNKNIKSTIFDRNIKPFQIDENNNKTINFINTINSEKDKNITKKITNQIFFNQNNKFINKNFDINIIKPLKYEFIKINNDKKIYLGIDLGNDETKIGVIKNYNEIQLMYISENNYSIPTMVSFRNNEILIGTKTDESMINNPSQTIFNIIKIFGHKYDEIINSNNQAYLLWPFKLYSDNYNRPYIKIKTEKEEKDYYFEEILVLFLKKLLDLLFQKISIENICNIKKNDKNKETLLNLSLIVSIPNYFSFFQRKLLEKLFLSEIFPINNSIYGGYKIILDKIGIENRSSMPALCIKNNPKLKINNILIIKLDTCSVDISIISIYDNVHKVIAVDSIELKNENFIDNFITLCLNILKQNNINIPKEFLYSISLLSKLRKLSSNIIKSLALREESIFIIDNLNNGNGNCIIKVNRIDYDKICFELCKKIIILIKQILIKANLNENDINDILLIGEEINSNKLNQMIKELFKNNKNINDKFSNSKDINLNDENENYFIVAGTSLRAYYLNNHSSFIFKNICPINIGIEDYNGNMDIIIKKNSELPLNIKKDIRIKNENSNDILIKIFEGEDNIAKNNILISQFIFNKDELKNFKDNKINNYLEISIEFQIDSYLNIIFFINDNKTYDHLFKCEINIEKTEN